MIKVAEIEVEARIIKGVRQRCTLSPSIFNVYTQEVINIIREKTHFGVKLNGQKIDITVEAEKILKYI